MLINNGKLTINEVDYNGIIDAFKNKLGMTDDEVDDIIGQYTVKRKKTWKDYIEISAKELLENKDDKTTIGKILAPGNEIFHRDWVNACTNVTLEDRDENDKINNASGYDSISKNKVRYQSKFRGGGETSLLFETTRRSSEKNKKSSKKTGHVPYSINEFDVGLFSIPNNKDVIDYNENIINNWSVMAIPVAALMDLDKPDYCLKSLPSLGILKHKESKPSKEFTVEQLFKSGMVARYGWKIYADRTKEIIEHAEKIGGNITIVAPQSTYIDIFE